ncbi:MAG: glycosyltransferase [Nitrospinaceae bacterium]|nr:glycosyltransferase [Nitrospinaceae bacterium]MBT3433318.1 glycosyltransferase [Nitrospinaceae bacterium]MBT3820435.1 glycosyltransferase [Nitrospinaceae bacterium]MBT4095547.1 glycosyltransferase [Nitrospinaceae bacterium]MBT4429569.1 glycosyltransferase [Nitrospinaceae bacterium]
MRIGILSPNYPPNREPCGIGDFTKMLVPELVRAGVEVLVLTSEGYSGPEHSDDARVICVAQDWNFSSLRKISRVVRDEKIDALLVQYAPDLYSSFSRWIHFLPMAMKLLAPGVPLALSMHTIGGPTFASKAGAGIMLAASSAILSTNEEVTYLIGKYMPWRLKRLWEVPIGANIEPFGGQDGAREEAARRKVCEERKLSDEGMILAHFGFYYPGKGAEQMLEAAARWKDAGREFRLFMIGGRRSDDGGFYPELQDRGRKLGLNDDVIWTGYVTPEEVTEILLAADLFLAPFDGGISSRRGSLMAAIAHGLPVVSTPPKIATRYFRAGENFAQVPFGDAVALADEVASLMDDPERRNLLREGSEVLSGVFSWSDIALRTRDFLEALLAGKRP